MKPIQLKKLTASFSLLLCLLLLSAAFGNAVASASQADVTPTPPPSDVLSQPRIDLTTTAEEAANAAATHPTVDLQQLTAAQPEIQIHADDLAESPIAQVAITIRWTSLPEVHIAITLPATAIDNANATLSPPPRPATTQVTSNKAKPVAKRSTKPTRTVTLVWPTPPQHRVKGGYNVAGPPTISASTIALVLKLYNSPSVGHAQAFYDLGVKYDIDPAFMLAFYIQESTAGTAGAAIQTLNIGNIVCSSDWQKAGGICSGRWRVYPSDIAAAEDWYQLIAGPGYVGQKPNSLSTVEQIVPKYAPAGDCNASKTQCNVPQDYINTVERLVDWFRSIEQART